MVKIRHDLHRCLGTVISMKRGTRCRWLSPQRVGLLMIAIVALWGIYLLSETHVRFKDGVHETDYLKREIVKLSKQYVHALAKEKKENELGSSTNQQTAILLSNMLERIEELETQLHSVILNTTSSFEQINEAIQIINRTIQTKSLNSVHEERECEVPIDNGYPQCAIKVEWMSINWKSQRKFKEHGVNGSVCSFLFYLSHVEDHCPKTFQSREVVNQAKVIKPHTDNQSCLNKINDPAFPACKNKIQWMKQFWKSDPLYASHGVDGTLCSIVKYLSEVENWCPLLDNGTPQVELCDIPKDPGFPHCGDKVAWMRKFWKTDPCYRSFGVNGSICSFVSYLSEVENWCPLYPGRNRLKIGEGENANTEKPNLSQTNVDDLIAILKTQEAIKIKWMSERISRLWKYWLAGRQELMRRVELDSYPRKKILIYIGLLADEGNFHFAAQATKGGPLGELVQWSDLIAALYLLGHDITISLQKNGKYSMQNMLKSSVSGLCPSRKKAAYDLIYTDYIGLSHMIRKYKNVNSIKCYLRIVDSFGTEAEFNHAVDKSVKNMYGFHDLNLKQYNTMFPHSPDNTFLGFVVENSIVGKGETLRKRNIALVYGKHVSMWQDPKKIAFLDIIQKYFEVHATVGNAMENSKLPFVLPRYVKNHGVLKTSDLQELLKETTLFVGLGFPYEGPAPLEAIANGCFFLNPKLNPSLGRRNDKFFNQKPTFRELSSQHPYAERFIGKPYVYTVDLSNTVELEAALSQIDDSAIEPYIPFEFTYEGMLERLFALTKHHNFCGHGGNVNNTWPPLSSRQIFLGAVGQGCDQVCENKGLICEPEYFETINTKEYLKNKACLFQVSASLIAPAVTSDRKLSKTCILQGDALRYSCTAKSRSSKRLCPCRDFVKGQTALCEGCLDKL